MNGYLGGGNLFIRDLPKRNCVKVGRFWYPPSAYEDLISCSVRPVINESADVDILQGFMSLGGSASLIRCGGQPLICLTRHQASKHLPFSDAMDCLRVGSKQVGFFDNLSVDQVIYTENCSDEELGDIIFVRPYAGDPLYQSELPYFLPAQRLSAKHINSKFIFVGYPFDLSQNHLHDDGKSARLEMVTLLQDCELDQDFETSAAHVNRFKYIDDGTELNGLSGGAVFGLLKKSDGFEGFLWGIITRAGNGFIYTVSANHLLSVI